MASPFKKIRGAPIELIAESFWSKVKKGPGCWIWTMGRTRFGYGQIQARAVSEAPMLSHRVAWVLSNGPIPKGKHVLHECDNPPCCNPAHLFLGDQRTNNDDRIKKKRTASGDRNGARTHPERNPFVRNHGSGLSTEQSPNCKLKNSGVRMIRKLFKTGKFTKTALGKRFGISGAHVARILTKESRIL